MIIVIKDNISTDDYERIKKYISERGGRVHESEGIEKRIIGVIGEERHLDRTAIAALPGVEKVIPIVEPYKLASRKFHPKNTIVNVKGVKIGGIDPVVIAGPCSVESEKQIWEIAEELSKKKAHILRGGIFKPRSSPYTFQGIGEPGIMWLAESARHYNLPVVSEVMEISDIDVLYDHIDIFQVGARNMQNFKLLKALGKTDKPILLKRGISATFSEFLMSAEYILAEGNEKVILCERGIRTFVEFTRNTFDVNIIPVVKKSTHLPIIIDPSHATGRSDIITPITLAGLAAGADGFMVEVHPRPFEAFSDGNQSLNFERFTQLLDDWNVLKDAVITLRKKTNEEVLTECI